MSPTTDSDLTTKDVAVGDQLPVIEFPLTIYRMVMWAGANRDFNSIHHNSEYAKQSGAPDMYANIMFLMGTWERTIREWVGPRAQIKAIREFRMHRFNTVGQTILTRAEVVEIKDNAVVVVKIAVEDDDGVTVGPGKVEVQLIR